MDRIKEIREDRNLKQKDISKLLVKLLIVIMKLVKDKYRLIF